MSIIEVAKKYLGMDEKPGNVFDLTTDLGKMLKKAGHNDGDPWCCLFAEGVACEAYPEREIKLRKMFSANCFETYCNALRQGYKVYNYPVKGGIIIFQYVKAGVQTTKGHAAICTEALSRTKYDTIEGNTSEEGSREGTTVGEQKGRDTLSRDTGLQFLGCIVIE
jgi:hypothetical protein